MGRTILLTGSSGLIGTALGSKLKFFGWTTVGMDIRGNPDLRLDIMDSASPISSMDLAGIIHLAAISRVIEGERDPALCRAVNAEGTQIVLTGALRNRAPPWIIYASSREVYGQQEVFPVPENAALRPMNAYARSKAEAENAVADARRAGLKSAIVRFSNVYGSVNDHADRVVPAFAAAAARGGVLRVDGSQNTFDFTHLDDVVDGVLRVVSVLESSQQLPGPIHFVSGCPTTLGHLASLAVELGCKGTRIVEASPRSFDVARFYGDPSLTARILDWNTKVELRCGFSQLIDDFKNSATNAC